MAHELDFAALSLDDAVPADLGAYELVQARSEADARNRALELKAQACDNAADACWYLARSLGAARDLPQGGQGGEASLELLFQLIGALADLPTDIATAPLPEIIGGRDDGITELCLQLEAARELTEEALIDAELAPARTQLCH
ncbi:MAG: hypothetical protein JF607_17845 [Burkholderiales bacterium]|nr:hypothetical protein [Burkholderiales bacterium]